MWFLFGVAVGLVVGWNFLEQPAFVKRQMEKVFGGDETEQK